MSAIERLLAMSPPKLLFHYTTQQGLLGMVSSGEVWATMSSYLNDSSEFRVVIEVAREVVAARRTKTRSSKELKLLSHMENAIGHAGINVCVCSFSADEDSLSQWRAYGGGGTGYAVGFDSIQLAERVRAAGYILCKCIYDPNEQRDLLENIVDLTLKENISAMAEGKYGEDDFGNARNFGFYLNRSALVFKDPSFKEEKEWRIISRPTSYRAEGIAFRCAALSLVPYQKVAISFGENDLPISHILVGPTARPDESREAVNGLLINRSRALHRVKVGNSVIPFRN